MPERNVQRKIFKEIGGRQDCRLFRNNCGMAVYLSDSKGGIKKRRVKFGVCNPGGSDLIGWRSITITPDMIGDRLAVFLAIETKAPKKGPNKNQRNFINQVRKAGGLAGSARNIAEAIKIIEFLGENL